jgi:hypothetical protein
MNLPTQSYMICYGIRVLVLGNHRQRKNSIMTYKTWVVYCVLPNIGVTYFVEKNVYVLLNFEALCP